LTVRLLLVYYMMNFNQILSIYLICGWIAQKALQPEAFIFIIQMVLLVQHYKCLQMVMKNGCINSIFLIAENQF